MKDNPLIRFFSEMIKTRFHDHEYNIADKHINSIKSHIEHIATLDDSGFEFVIHPYSIKNAFKDDVCEKSSLSSRIHSLAPKSKNQYIVVPKVI